MIAIVKTCAVETAARDAARRPENTYSKTFDFIIYLAQAVKIEVRLDGDATL